MGSGWFLESIKVGSNSTKELYIFKVEDWLDKNEGDEKVEKELERTSVEVGSHSFLMLQSLLFEKQILLYFFIFFFFRKWSDQKAFML